MNHQQVPFEIQLASLAFIALVAIAGYRFFLGDLSKNEQQLFHSKFIIWKIPIVLLCVSMPEKFLAVFWVLWVEAAKAGLILWALWKGAKSVRASSQESGAL